MATSINSSGITFPDGSTQTTSASGSSSFNAVGSYCLISWIGNGGGQVVYSGSNYSAGGGNNQVTSTSTLNAYGATYNNNLSGTWKWMGANYSYGQACIDRASAVGVRVA
jgi:hypothetical protein